jgi:hypothetical protein
MILHAIFTPTLYNVVDNSISSAHIQDFVSPKLFFRDALFLYNYQ